MKQSIQYGIVWLLGIALLTPLFGWSQGLVTGTVSDENEMPLPGATVVVEETNAGTTTDFDGNYQISASTGQTLIFSYVGYESHSVAVGTSSSIDVQLQAANELEEVVVTALGIEREKRALGYSVTEVGSEKLEQRSEGDVARILRGKSAGINITQQNGLSGSGTNIIIRGQNSFSSSNQALFIVDGVPFSTDTNSSGREGDRLDFINGNNGSTRFLDLDPNAIQSISVLKGLAAATLYGSAGRNGVILITTKAGSSSKSFAKSEITFSSSYFITQIASLPDYQNEYGNGFDQSFGWFFSNWGPSFRKDGVAGWGNSSSIDENGTLEHPYSTASSTTGIPQAFPEFDGARYEWRPYDSVKNFFNKGNVANLSLNISKASDDGQAYNFNFGHLSDEGFTPKNNLSRTTIGVGGSSRLNNNFTINGTLNFAETNFVSPPVALSQGNGSTGSGSSIFGDLWFTPRSINIQGLPFQNPITGGSVYYRQNNSIQHPLWTVNNSGTTQKTNRVFGNSSLSYKFADWLTLTYRAGIDTYSEENVVFQNKGGVNTNSGDIRLASGIYETWNNNNTIWDHNIFISGNYSLTDDVDINYTSGITTRSEVFNQKGVASDGQQAFGTLIHSNFLNQNEIDEIYERNIIGAYSQLDIDFKDYVYLTLAGRKDWVSNFSKDNRSIFYPSASISFIPTSRYETLKSSRSLNYLKIRAGYGTSANFGDLGYPVANTTIINTAATQNADGRTVVTNSTSKILGNSNLKPELLQEFEIGVESRLLENRINLDLSLYQRTTRDLIVNRPLDPATGKTEVRTNVGEVNNKGIEIDLGFSIFKTQNKNQLRWDSSVNFTASESEVTDLGLDTELIIYSGFSNLGNAAIKGEPLGVLYGSRVQRQKGELLVGNDGSYVQDPEDGIIGDPNPDWVSNLQNSISYKNFTFDFQLSYKHGGDIYSSTISTLLGRGLITETINRENTYILPGVNADGEKNRTQINNSDYYFGNVLFGPSELQVYDGSVIRLQEASLSYKLSDSVLKKTPFGHLSLTLSAYNLWYDAINTPDGARFDPNTSGTGVGNGFGFDFLNGPSAKRYGASLKATF